VHTKLEKPVLRHTLPFLWLMQPYTFLTPIKA
jgi:hypothetical protein